MPEEVIDGMTMQVEVPAEVHVGNGSTVQTHANDGFSGKPEDIRRDLDLLRSQMGQGQNQTPAPVVENAPPAQEQVQTPVVPEPVQPEGNQPPPATATQPTPEVPDKFKRADGTVDMERFTASYLEAERALKKAQQAASQPKIVPDAPPGSPVRQDSFESQIENDIKQYGIGPVLTRLFNASQEAAYAKARQDIDVVMAQNEENNRIAELKSIGEKDPWVFSEKGMAELMAIRQANPWINQSPKPMETAYLFAKGREAVRSKSPAPQVQTPNPKGPTPPPAAVGPVVRTTTQKLDTPEKLQTFLKTLTPEQEKVFWKKQGFRF